MDISCPLEMSVSEDVNRFHGLKQLSLNPSLCNYGDEGGVSLNELGDGLTEVLHIQDDQKSASSSISFPHTDKNDIIGYVEKKDSCEEACNTKLTNVTSDKCLSKCAMFSCSCEINSFAVDEEEEGDLNETAVAVLKENGSESAKLAYSQPISSPTPLKLVSALKGSREKQGIPPMKLTVKWAPDVYDPPPTSVSHVPTNKKQRQRRGSKKNGKNKQKGKGKGKPTREDRKQVQKSGGSSKKCYKSFNSDDRLVECNQTCVDLVDFDVGISDSYCGSSFLKKSVTKMHFSVAEAM